ncbi:hypothetical protein EVAR_57069_1 [Eumeta japonica]|uniref:Uncharacterized protein n=1 Tax=Eumeta variegata TaxID=151549 RepID=A0A4C1Y991_EUMVA|nr:hypothetical protein EVAR_57069_1 [Eumeta japonica]
MAKPPRNISFSALATTISFKPHRSLSSLFKDTIATEFWAEDWRDYCEPKSSKSRSGHYVKRVPNSFRRYHELKPRKNRVSGRLRNELDDIQTSPHINSTPASRLFAFGDTLKANMILHNRSYYYQFGN